MVGKSEQNHCSCSDIMAPLHDGLLWCLISQLMCGFRFRRLAQLPYEMNDVHMYLDVSVFCGGAMLCVSAVCDGGVLSCMAQNPASVCYQCYQCNKPHSQFFTRMFSYIFALLHARYDAILFTNSMHIYKYIIYQPPCHSIYC